MSGAEDDHEGYGLQGGRYLFEGKPAMPAETSRQCCVRREYRSGGHELEGTQRNRKWEAESLMEYVNVYKYLIYLYRTRIVFRTIF